jgi:hypothetical protein
MTIETMVILAAATWYAAYALSSTHGPGGVFDWIREHMWHGRTGYNDGATTDERGSIIAFDRKYMHNGLLDCPICLAFWVALILVTVTIGHVDIVQTLAVAGLAMLAHGITGWRFAND